MGSEMCIRDRNIIEERTVGPDLGQDSINSGMIALVINPKILYFTKINIITRINPIISAIIPALIESCPKSGPTVLSSIMFKGAGNAPDLNNRARSVAD